MRDIRMILPNMASDTAGAASALFQTDGLTVIHDAAGSLESFITFDEHRDLSGKRTVASRLSRLEAVTGDDSILLGKLEQECTDDPPPFAAIIGSPVPFTIGTDLEGIAAEAEDATGVPTFAVTAGGFGLYDKGAGEAIQKLIAKTTRLPTAHAGLTVNLLGATPLDYSEAEIDQMKAHLLAVGVRKVNTLTMADGMKEVYQAADVDRNIVISLAGIPAARYMKKTYGIPYTIEVPLAPHSAATPAGECQVLLLGESVLTKQLTALLNEMGIPAVAGVTGSDDSEIFPEVSPLLLPTEESIRRELRKGYFAVVGDPLYKLLLPRDSKTVYIERPHRALSSRLYPPTNQTIDQLICAIQEVF